MSMSDATLQSLVITDFRSIRGTVVIPLDARVVLLHGQNGAGKTSVMSALELALNGQIADLADTDRRHLVHRGTKTAIVELTSDVGSARISSDDKSTKGEPLLKETDARFFTERCYLAQRRLGQLLEIYARAPANGDSPLTRFVKDLLGLDELDALIDGLEPVKDIRLVKKLVPEYRAAADSIDEQRGQLASATAELQARTGEAMHARERLGKSLDTLGAPATADADLPGEATTKWIRSGNEEAELDRLEAARREIQSARLRHAKLSKQAGAGRARSAGKDADAARDAADAWWKSSGSKLETVLDEIRNDIPTIATAVATDPAAAHEEALEQINGELQRTKATLTTDERAATEMKRLDGRIRTAQKRVEKIDRELVSLSSVATGRDLASTLAALVPHLHGDDCPVCGRDYSEIGDQSLASHLAEEISRLSAQAERMQELVAARLEAVTAASTTSRLQERQAALRLDAVAKDALSAKEARFNRYRSRLVRLKAGVSKGATIMRRVAESERSRAIAQQRDREATALASTLEILCQTLQLKPPRKNETTGETIGRLERYVTPEIQRIKARQEARRTALVQLKDLRSLVDEQRALETEVKHAEIRLAETQRAVRALEKRRNALKKLREDSQNSRTRIIRQVFNNSLNHMWRDLFVRLAPDEPFVPAFLVPDGRGGVVTANLTTTHRDGKTGGSPVAMLSAGNLNTAALTLFLALHLTAKPTLPWLLLDDPVQSMDEVHVAQLAAVLRTLTRQHKRRIIIAVHEQALFDYLALELSPATPTDSLITVEMTRNPDGDTTLTPSRRRYKSDPALAAA
jgi:exonuclease SbcC